MPFQRRFRSGPAFLIAQAVSLFLHAPPILQYLQFRKNEKTFRNFAGPYSPAAVAEPEALHTFFRSSTPMSAITPINAGGQTNERLALPCFSETKEQMSKKSAAGRSATSPRGFYLCFRFLFIPFFRRLRAKLRSFRSGAIAAFSCRLQKSRPRFFAPAMTHSTDFSATGKPSSSSKPNRKSGFVPNIRQSKMIF